MAFSLKLLGSYLCLIIKVENCGILRLAVKMWNILKLVMLLTDPGSLDKDLVFVG